MLFSFCIILFIVSVKMLIQCVSFLISLVLFHQVQLNYLLCNITCSNMWIFHVSYISDFCLPYHNVQVVCMVSVLYYFYIQLLPHLLYTRCCKVIFLMASIE